LKKEAKLTVYPPGKLNEKMIEAESIYFTHINRVDNVVTGYKLSKDFTAIKVWNINVGNSKEKILRVETQFQTASATDHLHVTPTAFSGENLIYKYLDSNVFILTCVNAVDDLVIYLVNGVSGKVIY